jgi:phosphoglycolate phosphatase
MQHFSLPESGGDVATSGLPNGAIGRRVFPVALAARFRPIAAHNDGFEMRLILFDVDGTLVDSQQMICAAMAQAYADHGIVCPSREQVLSIVGLSLDEAFSRLAGGADHPVASLTARYRETFFALRKAGKHEAPLYPGVRATIEQLAQHSDVVLGIATGKSRRGVAAMLDKHDFMKAFATIQTSDTSPSKPHPGMVLQAMAETGIDAADTVVIGDTAFDMEMARAAGAAAIGVSWGYHAAADLHAAGAVAVIDDFAALDAALDTRWRAAPPTGANDA